MNTLELIRDTYSDMGTFGKLHIDGKFFCYTVERPWKGNNPKDSCIPEGRYKLVLRYSPIVEKTSRGEFKEGYEVTGVPDRSLIMIHVANSKSDLLGCVGVGDNLGFVNGEWAVLNSVATFRKLMNKMDNHNDWDINIHQYKYS